MDKSAQQDEMEESNKELKGISVEGNNSTVEAPVDDNKLNESTEITVSTSQVILCYF